MPVKVIAIIGAGYCGTLTAVHILRQNPVNQVRVVLVEQHSRPGRGLAYRTWDDNFLLNVPAGNMSALADDPDHFVRFCQNIDPAFNAASFISRRLYGDYLELTLREEITRHRETVIETIHDEAVAVHHSGNDAYQIDLRNGASICAHQIVLALGHFPPLPPAPVSEFYKTPAYINNPWDSSALERILGNAPVALLGMGLTALDVLFRLTSSSDTRKMYLISRRGLCPQPHRFHPKAPIAVGFPHYLENLPPTAKAYCHALRLEIERNAVRGGDWRDIMNALRPHSPEIWRRFSVKERRKFLSHLVAYWDIHRHRLAPSAHLRLSGMLKSGQAEMIAGYVRNYKTHAGQVSVEISERHTGRIRCVDVGHVVNCTGPSFNLACIASPLMVQLRSKGYLRQDANRLGIEVNERYQLIDCTGDAAKNLFYVGPMLKARFWEAIAVPELRIHVRALAKILANS